MYITIKIMRKLNEHFKIRDVIVYLICFPTKNICEEDKKYIGKTTEITHTIPEKWAP